MSRSKSSIVNSAAVHMAAVLLTALPCLPSLAGEPGETWEITSEMQAAGMSLPATTQQICSPKDAADEPQGIPTQENCELYDVQHSGSTTSWKMRCKGDPPTSGSGKMTYSGKDSYRGEMHMTVGSDEMHMKMSGRRLGTACDAGRIKRQVAAAQAQSAQYQDQFCKSGVDAMTAYTFTGASGIQCAPGFKNQYCANLKTESGYDKVADMEASAQGPAQLRSDLTAAASLCGLPAAGAGSLASIRGGLCAQALAGESLVFLGRNCEVEGRELALRECAGRGYSSPVAPKYREFCEAYARHGALPAAAAGEAATTPDNPRDSAIKAGKKALRGLIGF